jgi:hypothetical protein
MLQLIQRGMSIALSDSDERTISSAGGSGLLMTPNVLCRFFFFFFVVDSLFSTRWFTAIMVTLW